MSPDPFADEVDPAQQWVETGPPRVGDVVEVRLRGRVTEYEAAAGGDYFTRVRLDGGPLLVVGDEVVTYRPSHEVTVVERMRQESGAQES